MKKEIPLVVLESLQTTGNKIPGWIKQVEDKGAYFHLEDMDENSDFYFIVGDQSQKGDFNTQFKPTSKRFVDPSNLWLDADNLAIKLKEWIELVSAYNELETIFDDPIEQSYYDELEPKFKFKIIDEDANYKPFSTVQQIKIVAFLDSALEIISSEDDGDSEAIDLIKRTKKTISKSTKNQVVENIRRIIAKGCKMGLEVGKKLLIEFTSELAKKLLLGI